MTSLLNIKAYEIDIVATQQKFDENWQKLFQGLDLKISFSQDDKVDLEFFHKWQENINKPINICAKLRERRSSLPSAKNPIIFKRIKEIQETDDYKFAIEFNKYDWTPILIDVGERVRQLERMVDDLSSEVRRLQPKSEY